MEKRTSMSFGKKSSELMVVEMKWKDLIMRECIRLVYDLENPGKLKKITGEHSFAWSGKIPCTGVYKCVFCGYIPERKWERKWVDRNTG